MEWNHLHAMWLFYSFVITFSGLNIFYVKSVPAIFVQLYSFGKVNKSVRKENNVTQYLEIPKRWFSHFYVFASLYMPFVTLSVFGKYFYNYSNPYLLYLLNMLGSMDRKGDVKPESVIILSVLLTLQVFRRCYECFYVSVYSNSKMNLFHYIVGFTFYFGVGLSLIHDAPGFEAHNWNNNKYTLSEWFTLAHCIGTVVFFVAYSLQFETHKAFAAMRKSGDKVVSTQHLIPSSGMFEYVSCPHYFSEILIYLSGSLILHGRSFSWWLVCLWTASSQIMTGIMSHNWYKKTFKQYPKSRKAVIPFLI